MFRSMLILVLIALVGFFSSGLPIEINDLLYIPVERSVSYSFQPAYSEVTNPQTVKFAMTTTRTSVNIQGTQGKNIKIEVFKDGNKLEAVNYDEEASQIPDGNFTITRNNPLIVQLDISQKTTRLPDGEYIFKFSSSNSKLDSIEPLDLRVTYKSNPQYYKSLNYYPKGTMGIVLYFPEKGKNYMVPVTRFVPYTQAVLNTTASNLVTGANFSTGLIDTDIIPHINKVFYNGSTVYVDINSRSDRLKDNPRLFHALDSIVYSMCEIPGMERVQFLLDGKRVEEISPGITTGSPWSPETTPAAYLALNTVDRYLIIPYRPDTSSAGSIREIAYILFQTLKKGIEDDHMVMPVIPEEVKLLNVYYLHNTITLDFNPAFLEAYKGNRQKQTMMMDAILYTYTTIPGVQYVKILIEGNDQYTFADNRLTNRFKRPLYINPETN